MVGGELDRPSSHKKIEINSSDKLLEIDFQIGDKIISLDMRRLLDLKGVDIDSIPGSKLDRYLGYISSLRFTLDSLINDIERRENIVQLGFDITSADLRTKARKELLEDGAALVEAKTVAKSFISEPTKEKINDKVILYGDKNYEQELNELRDLQTNKKFITSLLKSITEVSMCLMNVAKRREN